MFQSHQKIRYFTDFWSLRLNLLEAFNIGIFGIIWVREKIRHDKEISAENILLACSVK